MIYAMRTMTALTTTDLYSYFLWATFPRFVNHVRRARGKTTADKLTAVLANIKIVGIHSKRIDAEIKEKILGAEVRDIETFGKNIVISFSSGIFLRTT